MNQGSLTENLRRARDSAIVSYHRVLRDYNKRPNSVFGFFEAQDDITFYRQWLEQYLTENPLQHFACDGKGGVKYCRKLIEQKAWPRSRFMFFLDKDVDDFLSIVDNHGPNTFVTKHYSIEGYFASDDVLLRCLSDLVKIDEEHAKVPTIVQAFLDGLSQLSDCSVAVMAWVIAHRRAGASVRLSDVSFDHLYRFDVDAGTGSVTVTPRRGRQSRLAPAYPDANQPQATISQILAISREIRSQPCFRSWLRGKWVAAYMIKFIRAVPAVMNHGRTAGEPRYRLLVDIREQAASVLFSPRCRIPPELGAFLGQAASRAP